MRNQYSISNLPAPLDLSNDGTIGRADPLLTDRESAAVLHVAVSTFRRYVAKGLVPPPVKLGSTSRWPQSEILAVIETAKEARCRGPITDVE